MENNALIKVINDSKVEPDTATNLQKAFAPFLATLNVWSDKSKTLVVTDASQVREMKIAREARLALKDIRVKANKKRIELKEDSTRYGKAVQAVYNLLEGMITPMEEHFSKQELFVEIQEKKRKDAIRTIREEETKDLNEFISVNTDLGEIGEERYQEILLWAKAQLKNKIEEEAKLEKERIAKEEAEEVERKRILAENERLKKEALARQAEQNRINAENATLKAKLKQVNTRNEDTLSGGYVIPSYIATIDTTPEAQFIPKRPLHCFLCGSQLEEGKFALLDCPDCLTSYSPFIDSEERQCLALIN